jgi:hypothetical protein
MLEETFLKNSFECSCKEPRLGDDVIRSHINNMFLFLWGAEPQSVDSRSYITAFTKTPPFIIGIRKK